MCDVDAVQFREEHDGLPESGRRVLARRRSSGIPGVAALTLTLALLPEGCAQARPGVGDVFSKPQTVLHLPKVLREISALTVVDENTLACVQDDVGSLFFVDARSGELVDRARFGADGDYEGLARVGPEYFVLRSDGVLLRLARKKARFEILAEFALGLANHEFESLFHDEPRGVLLLAPKDKPEVARDELAIYAFDLQAGKLAKDPVLVLSRQRLLAEAVPLGPALSVRVDKHGRTLVDLQLKISDLALHPTTRDLYLLSGVDRALLVLDELGHLKAIHVFGPQELPKPEGIAFFANGDLMIASEGDGGAGVIWKWACPAPGAASRPESRSR